MPRGRPPEADPEAISDVAMKLFEAEGFEEVTMAAVAEAAGVSRRTVFRLFPSKADLVWFHLVGVEDQVAARLGELGRGLSLQALVAALFEPTLRQLDDAPAAEDARRRLRLVASHPALLTHPALDRLQALMIEAVAEHVTLRPGVAPALVARTLTAVGLSAALWWAEEGGESSPLAATRQALEAVADAVLG